MKKCRQSDILEKSAASRSSYEKVPPIRDLIKKIAASRSSYEKVPPIGDLRKKCRQSELL